MDPMTQIRVDIEVLRATVRTFTEAAQRVLADSRDVETAVEGASGYDGQLRARVSAIAGQAGPDIRAFADHVAELAAELESVADGFEAADAAQVAGLAGLAVSFRTMIDSGYGAGDLPLWLVRGAKPPWMSAEEWARLGGLGDRAAYMADLQRAWASFVSGDLAFNHGTHQDMLNAFRVHLFLEGVTPAIPLYADWQSAATAAGLSLEGYVMKVLNITHYERDSVAGVGLIETRQVGPLATLLVGQAYYNRLYDDHWGDLDSAKSTFAEGWLDGVYYGHNWEGYTQAALALPAEGNNIFTYTGEQLGIHYAGGEAAAELDRIASIASAAEAAQDGAWRLIAGYRLAEDYGVDGVTFFLNDPASDWWTYNQELDSKGFLDYSPMRDLETQYREDYTHYLQEQGLSGERLEAKVTERMANAIFPALQVPDNLETALELIEKSHSNTAVYEMNPDYEKFVEWKMRDLKDGFFEDEVTAELAEHRPEFEAQVRAEALRMEEPLSPVQLEAEIKKLEDARKAQLQVIMPRYLWEAYVDGTSPQGRDYWDSLIILQNARTDTAFVTFFTPDATNFFPSH